MKESKMDFGNVFLEQETESKCKFNLWGSILCLCLIRKNLWGSGFLRYYEDT